ncbi:endothelin-converting enzyme homolog isoform X2 [Anastrepha obliqua]|uniref:endothelin-converting enzyme homolog isoform X2 n=1 Tax=Anastrepha obliqua TaxID=95512 RepID=UPI002409A0F8|nr:endothelin-converting enzyme homolog isoform X2 [Anastrepha obliqua]
MAATGSFNSASHTATLHKQMSFGGSYISRTDENEVSDGSNINSSTKHKKDTMGWICCAPCIWLRTSTTVHKIAITAATFLECFSSNDECNPTSSPPPECSEEICRSVATSIQSKIDWNSEPCTDLKNFSCSSNLHSNKVKAMQSIQETVDIQMQHLLQHNTTTGPFRKLGRLFSSCLRQTTNSSTIKLVLEQLGGYLPIGAVGPTSISSLISKIYTLGPTPLVDIYYDLSYGRRPQVLLIIGGPVLSAPILENNIRWLGPKAPPYKYRQGEYQQLNKLLDDFLPNDLSLDQKSAEKEAISTFINELNSIRVEHSLRGFWNSSVLYNISSLQEIYPFLNWTNLMPKDWNKPIIVRSPDYLKAVEELLLKYSSRVAHNSILILFTLGILPQEYPNPTVCTRATMWALPDITSALFVAHHSNSDLQSTVKRTDLIFKSLKAYLKRAPSLKGAALVKLSSLRIQSEPWKGFTNITAAAKQLESMDITSDNWFENMLKIFGRNKLDPSSVSVDINSHDAWAYPIVARIFYDTLSHSIVVPLSVIMVPYFDDGLPPYLQYASVGVHIAKEILRSITKSFEDKAMHCVPDSVKVFSNHSQMDILIHSGGMQISYHSMLSITGPMKGMARLPGLNLTPTQIFFLLLAQEICMESEYIGIDTEAADFEHILIWLIAQGGSASDVFKCQPGSVMYDQKTCNVL